MSEITAKAATILKQYMSPILTDPIMEAAVLRSGVDPDNIRMGDGSRLVRVLKQSCKLFVRNSRDYAKCCKDLDVLLTEAMAGSSVDSTVVTIKEERDIVVARATGRDMCEEIGFPISVRIGVATVISELARNIHQYAKTGNIVLSLMKGERGGIEVFAVDDGPGIPFIEEVLSGRYKSKTGLGQGLLVVKKMMDEFEVSSALGEGTKIRVRKYLDARR
ncbi:MAG: hypothetical protein J7M25_10255 [Deltaproteobacteria bacterium]|nr:hypothetical protein [Deltaproteobacteria bacterium]